jgi:hypothetical protein
MSKHVSWSDVTDGVDGTYGWPNRPLDENPNDLFKDPPRASDTTANNRQQTLLLAGILNAIKALARKIDELPAKLEKQRLSEQLKLAKEERRSAEARERAALAELNVKLSEPPVMYQCDDSTLEKLAERIRHRF